MYIYIGIHAHTIIFFNKILYTGGLLAVTQNNIAVKTPYL